MELTLKGKWNNGLPKGERILGANGKRRDKLEIMADIIEIAKESAMKTEIMYKANLSFAQLNDYLDFMIGNNLITSTNENGKEIYVITDKGRSFLQKHSELVRLLKEL